MENALRACCQGIKIGKILVLRCDGLHPRGPAFYGKYKALRHDKLQKLQNMSKLKQGWRGKGGAAEGKDSTTKVRGF